MMRTALVLAFMAFAASAHAQQRPFTPRLACGQAQQIVAANGAVVLGTGTYTYDRYVRDRTFCQRNETTEVAFVPTRDTAQCPVYRCREIELDLFD